MPYHGQIPSKEKNTQSQGRSGAETPKKAGPAKSPATNPTQGGGINRPTRGKS